jgi:hypothetical protein
MTGPRAALALVLALAAGPVRADCPGAALVDCPIAGSAKHLSLCLTDDALTYEFGPPGRPELRLMRDLAGVSYTPWPGIGRTIWEDISLENQGITYAVHSWRDKMMAPDQPGAQGTGLIVLRGDTPLAEMDCAGAPYSDFLPLGEALIARGLCLDATGWRPGPGGWRCE